MVRHAAWDLEDLKALEADLRNLKHNHPEVYERLQTIIQEHSVCGYANIAKIIAAKTYPEELAEEWG